MVHGLTYNTGGIWVKVGLARDLGRKLQGMYSAAG